MKKIAIIGFGRFGEYWAGILRADFEVLILEVNPDYLNRARAKGYQVISTEQLGVADIIFIAVPISKIDDVLKEMRLFVNKNQLVMDVCSVKVYPSMLMKKYLPDCELIATHPLFGPDSGKNGLDGLKMALCPLRVKEGTVEFWNSYWTAKKVDVKVTTPEDHDQESIYSQGLTYTIAKIINLMSIPSLTFTTKSFDAIQKVAISSAHDSDQLFHDMLFYNPYFKPMKDKLELVLQKVNITLNAVLDETNTKA